MEYPVRESLSCKINQLSRAVSLVMCKTAFVPTHLQHIVGKSTAFAKKSV